MFIPDFKITAGKLALIIYGLAINEREVRNRLAEVFTERCTLGLEDFPIELQDDWKYIYDFMTSKPANSYESRFKTSLRNKRNTTCSKVVRRIIHLYEELKRYI